MTRSSTAQRSGNNNQNNSKANTTAFLYLPTFFALDIGCNFHDERVLFEPRGSDVVIVTCTLSPDWDHLSSYFLLVHVRQVDQEEEGALVWCSYVATRTGASLTSWLMLPKSVGGVLGMARQRRSRWAYRGVWSVRVSIEIRPFEWKRILIVVLSSL